VYVKCGSLEDAQQVFDRIIEWDMVSLTTMIVAHEHFDNEEEVHKIFYRIVIPYVKPNQFSFVNILKDCIGMRSMEGKQQVYVHIFKVEFQGCVYVGSSLLDMYTKC